MCNKSLNNKIVQHFTSQYACFSIYFYYLNFKAFPFPIGPDLVSMFLREIPFFILPCCRNKRAIGDFVFVLLGTIENSESRKTLQPEERNKFVWRLMWSHQDIKCTERSGFKSLKMEVSIYFLCQYHVVKCLLWGN